MNREDFSAPVARPLPKPLILGLATANPQLYASREEAYEFLVSSFAMTAAEQELYEKVLLKGPIRGRWIGMESFAEACQSHPDDLIRRFQHYGTEIAAEAAAAALRQARIDVSEVAGLVVNTCTGYLCPGLTSHVAERLGLRRNIRIFDLMGMGCGAALPNLDACAGVLARNSDAVMLSIAVEICSATMVMGAEPDLVVSNSIFGDGAAAAVLANQPADAAQPPLLKLLDFEATLHPEYREHLRYRNCDGRLQNRLHRNVPLIGARIIAEVVERLLARNGLSQAEIQHWVVHAGGTSVLESVQRRLQIEPAQLRYSYEIFAEYGNMSSPTVMYVLQRLLQKEMPAAGEKAVLLSFGAGFTGFGLLAEF